MVQIYVSKYLPAGTLSQRTEVSVKRWLAVRLSQAAWCRSVLARRASLWGCPGALCTKLHQPSGSRALLSQCLSQEGSSVTSLLSLICTFFTLALLPIEQILGKNSMFFNPLANFG